MKKFARHAIFYAGLLAIWALLAKLRVWPSYVFPSPWGVLEALVAGFKDHSFWIAIAVSIAMATGRHQIPKIYKMAGRNLGARRFRLFWHVLLPASLPYIVSGLKQGWAFAWRSLISGEMIFVSLGLGQLLMMGRDLNDMSLVIAVMILIIAIGYIVDGLVFKTIERRLQQKWGLT